VKKIRRKTLAQYVFEQMIKSW